MSHIRPRRGARASLAAVALLASFGGTVLVTGLTGGSSAASTTAQHYLCYKASAKKGFSVPAGIKLVDIFSSSGFTPTVKGPMYALHCNPAAKTIPGAQFPITEPDWHFLGLKITAAQPANTVVMNNQFGQATLVTGPPNELLVPSWKSLTGPPNEPTNTPPGEDHYTCYPVKVMKGTSYKPPASVQVQDEFSAALTTVTVGKPQELCVPTTKILPTGQSFPPSNPNLYYVCFVVSKTPVITPVYDQNQFGQGAVTVKGTKWLCLPSTIG